MAHGAFPAERYNKPKLTITCRDGVWDAPHMEMMRFCETTVNGAAVWRTYLTYTHVKNESAYTVVELHRI